MTPIRQAKRPEKAIERDIIGALRDMGFAVTKFSQPRPSMITCGTPDLYASHPRGSLRVWLEVKRPGQEPTLMQRLWHEAERAAGGAVWVVRSVDDVLDQLRILGWL